MLKKILITLITTLIGNGFVYGQSFGFGCLGLVGGYGGYNYQQYQPGMLESYVNQFNSKVQSFGGKQIERFGNADGYRLGLNFFRAKFSNFFVTAKGFYQQLGESHEGSLADGNGLHYYDYDLKLRSWGIGLDIGIPVFNGLHWKILDGALILNTARLIETVNSLSVTSVQKFNNGKSELGYSIGSGFVVEILKNYISLEGIVAYSYLNIDEMKTDENFQFKNLIDSADENEPFIKSGGFNAVIQLNVGFPL